MKIKDKKPVGDNIAASNANWSFKGTEVAEQFDQHVQKSVPLYLEGHKLICRLSDFFVFNDSVAYDLGCSTGELTLKLAEHNRGKRNARFIGIDAEEAMITQAQAKLKAGNHERADVEFQEDEILQANLLPSDLIVSYYTLQFIRASEKQNFVNKVYSALKWGGAFVLFEKVRACDARFQDIRSSLYTDYKIEQ